MGTPRGLDLNVEDVKTERKSVDVSTQFTRATTTVVLGGAGEEGRGEDVTYTAEDHDWFPDLPAAGPTTLGELSAQLDGLRLFADEPKMKASEDYRRWAFESAALDLALRQNGVSLGLRWSVSTAGTVRRLDARRRVRVARASAGARAEARSRRRLG